jgi:hypothetical protein
VEIHVLASALKRDITEGDILHAVARPFTENEIEDDERGDWKMWVGPDLAARLIEVGFRIEDETIVVLPRFPPAQAEVPQPQKVMPHGPNH